MDLSMTPAIPAAENPEERIYRRRIFAWAMYDWGDHGFLTTTIVTFFPPYFIAIAATAFDKETAGNVFSLVLSLTLFLSAIVAPIVGTYADIAGRRKRVLIAITGLGSLFASLMVVLTTDMWVLGLILYAGTQIALNVALGMNSSLLPHVSRPDDLNRASSLAYALGYIGGGILLGANTALFLFRDKLGLGSDTAVQIAFFTTGIWWAVFTLPLALSVPEPPATPLTNSTGYMLADSLTRLRHTIRDIQRYRELFKMLIAFWLYSEGISAIILLATTFGASLGLDTSALITTILMAQFVALPYVLIFGRIPNPASKWRAAYVSMLLWTAITLPILGVYVHHQGDVGVATTFELLFADQLLGIVLSIFVGRRLLAPFTATLDTKRAVLFGLAIFMIPPIWGLFLTTQAEFFMIAWLTGTVQGGVQALSRTIYANMSPKAKSGEFFGLYGLSEKFAGILAPALYGIVGLLPHSPNASILSVLIFFIIGFWALWRVNEVEGTRIASAEDAAFVAAHAAD